MALDVPVGTLVAEQVACEIEDAVGRLGLGPVPAAVAHWVADEVATQLGAQVGALVEAAVVRAMAGAA